MATMTLDQYLVSRGLADNEAIEKSFQDALSELPLAALRETAGLTQAKMAKLLGQSQASVSKFEGRGDFLVSTLFRYVKALDGVVSLRIKVGKKYFSIVEDESDGEVLLKLVKQHIEVVPSKRSEDAANIHAFRKFAFSFEEKQHSLARAFSGEIQGKFSGKKDTKKPGASLNAYMVSSYEEKPIAA